LNTPATCCIALGIVHAAREEVLHGPFLDRGDGILPLGLARNRVGLAQSCSTRPSSSFLDRGSVGHREFARLLRGLLGKLDDGLSTGWKCRWPEHHGAEHDLLGQLLRSTRPSDTAS
jgi:hypothetical protein